MRYSLQPRFHLELGLMKLVHARRLASLEGLLAQLGQPRPAEKTMAAAAQNLRPDAVRSVPLKTPAAEPPQERVDALAAPGPSTPIGASAETRAATKVTPTGGSTSVASPRAAAETVHPGAAVSTPAEDARLSSIKAVLFDQSKRFLSSCLDHLASFRVDNGAVHFTFDQKDSLYADLLKAREQQETLRAVCAQVLGQPVRICVTLEELRAEAQVPRLSARERAERDPGVEAFRKKFDGALVDVQDLSQE
jgi:DNA polymerase-3 subunit gamma/tau